MEFHPYRNELFFTCQLILQSLGPYQMRVQCRKPFLMLPAMKAQFKQMASTEAIKMIESDTKIVVLDVRTADEFKEGHVKGAVNIDVKEADGLEKIGKLDHEATYIVYCRTNGRSTKAVNYMEKEGFKNLYLISDGFEGWKMNKFKVVK